MGMLKKYQRESAPGGFVDIPIGNSSANAKQLVLRTGYAQYNFAADGGAISTITLKTNWSFPATSIIIGGSINVTTTCVGAGGTLSIGTSAGSTATSILGATAVASLGAGVLIIPVCQTTPYKLSAAGSVTVTIASTAFTAGVIEIFLKYWIPVNA